MILQSRILFALILAIPLIWLIASIRRQRISTGQAVFWFGLMLGAEILIWSPALVDFVGSFWGDLVPVSWITFLGLTALIFYLLYMTIVLNRLRHQLTELVRSVAFLEKEIRQSRAKATSPAERAT